MVWNFYDLEISWLLFFFTVIGGGGVTVIRLRRKTSTNSQLKKTESKFICVLTQNYIKGYCIFSSQGFVIHTSLHVGSVMELVFFNDSSKRYVIILIKKL